jgi:chemotaxis protein MotA
MGEQSMLDVLSKMFSSIVSSDTIILIMAVITGIIFGDLRKKKNEFANNMPQWKHERRFKKISAKADSLKKWHNIFVTLISFFPLLGMLGTVIALLKLDLTEANDSVKNNFFDALTSTAWGIVFSLIFKGANAFIETEIQDHIDKAEKLLEDNDNAVETDMKKVTV